MNQYIEQIEQHNGILWAPIRHHSPQCSIQLIKLVKQVKPDRILIEGPSEANHLIPMLLATGSKPPLAFYMYAVDNKQHWPSSSNTATRYRCYVPFADMSPELVALKLAKRLKISAEFIDLPYIHRLELDDNRQRQTGNNEQLLNGEQEIFATNPIQKLISDSGSRNVDEWWDRHFETGAEPECPTLYFQRLLQFGLVIRQATNADKETLAREAFMAQRIRHAHKENETCLVVCGGYHCLGISSFLNDATLARETLSTVPIEVPVENNIHVVPYSLARLNIANGYSAGLPDCGYYDQYWKALCKPEPHLQSMQLAHQKLVAELTSTFQSLHYFVTTPDSIETCLVMERLADLRRIHPGRPELRDAVETVFLKDSVTENDPFHRALNRALAGEKAGQLSKQAPVAPLVADFRARCALLRLPQSPLQSIQKALELYRKPKHRSISQFLHQLRFLGIPYGDLEAGPRFAAGKDFHLVREVWEIRWLVESETQLIELSHWGNNIEDAALNYLLHQLNAPQLRGHEKSPLLVQALVMGLDHLLAPISESISDWLHLETELVPLCDSLQHLVAGYHSRSALDIQDHTKLQRLLQDHFQRICVRLPWLHDYGPEDTSSLCQSLIDLHGLITIKTPWCDGPAFYNTLRQVLQLPIAAKIQGLCCAALFSAGIDSLTNTQLHFRNAFSHSYLDPNQLGDFLWGFLALARALFITEEDISNLVTQMIKALDEDEFLQALPAMRLAFTQLSLNEKQTLGVNLTRNRQAAVDLIHHNTFTQQDLTSASQLREKLNQILLQYGVQTHSDEGATDGS